MGNYQDVGLLVCTPRVGLNAQRSAPRTAIVTMAAAIVTIVNVVMAAAIVTIVNVVMAAVVEPQQSWL